MIGDGTRVARRRVEWGDGRKVVEGGGGPGCMSGGGVKCEAGGLRTQLAASFGNDTTLLVPSSSLAFRNRNNQDRLAKGGRGKREK